MRVSVDTNVLVYSVDPNDRAKQASAIDVIRRVAQGRNPLIEPCLFEFLNATSRKLGVPIALSVATVSGWLASFDVAVSSKGAVSLAIQLLTQHKLSVWDARILSVCGDNGIDILLTEDLQDGAKYGKVTAINPFEQANAKILNTLLPP
jgi:predicted nucleic acid-binding protein